MRHPLVTEGLGRPCDLVRRVRSREPGRHDVLLLVMPRIRSGPGRPRPRRSPRLPMWRRRADLIPRADRRRQLRAAASFATRARGRTRTRPPHGVIRSRVAAGFNGAAAGSAVSRATRAPLAPRRRPSRVVVAAPEHPAQAQPPVAEPPSSPAPSVQPTAEPAASAPVASMNGRLPPSSALGAAGSRDWNVCRREGRGDAGPTGGTHGGSDGGSAADHPCRGPPPSAQNPATGQPGDRRLPVGEAAAARHLPPAERASGPTLHTRDPILRQPDTTRRGRRGRGARAATGLGGGAVSHCRRRGVRCSRRTNGSRSASGADTGGIRGGVGGPCCRRSLDTVGRSGRLVGRCRGKRCAA